MVRDDQIYLGANRVFFFHLITHRIRSPHNILELFLSTHDFHCLKYFKESDIMT